MAEIPSIHDKFFRSIFSEPKVARNFLENYIPANVLQHIDLNSLQAEKDSFVDPDLKDSYSDLLFKANVSGRAGFIYCLLEHKSYHDKWVPFQLLKYMVSIWERHKGDTLLPVIIPIVIYHGQKEIKEPPKFSSLFGPLSSAFADYVPNFSLEFKDISHLNDEEIRGEILNRTALMTMKYIFHNDFEKQLPNLLELLGELLNQERGLDHLRTFLYYITGGAEKVDPAYFQKALQTHLQAGASTMPVIAEEWIKEGLQRGRQEGLKEGMQQSRHETARRLLTMQISPEVISKATGLTEEEIKKINSN